MKEMLQFLIPCPLYPDVSPLFIIVSPWLSGWMGERGNQEIEKERNSNGTGGIRIVDERNKSNDEWQRKRNGKTLFMNIIVALYC